MISAVCGRAPPDIELPYDPLDPPPDPKTDHDWLSVMKTLAFSDSAVAFWFCCAGAKHNHKKGHREASTNDDGALLIGPPVLNSTRRNRLRVRDVIVRWIPRIPIRDGVVRFPNSPKVSIIPYQNPCAWSGVESLCLDFDAMKCPKCGERFTATRDTT